jgi:hypothetical protein
VEPPGVQLGGNGLDGGQLCVGVALGGDQLAPDFGSGQTTETAHGLKSWVGLAMLLNDGLDVGA